MHGSIDTPEARAQVRRAKIRFHFTWQEHVAARKGLTPAEKLIALRLALYRNVDSGRCDPSFIGLGEGSGTSRRTAVRAIAKLTRLGLIIVERSSGRRNYYHLTLPNDVSSNAKTTGAQLAHQCQTEHEPVPNDARTSAKRCQNQCQSLAPEHVEHVVSLRDTQHVKHAPLGATFAASPDGAAHVGQREEVAEGEPAGAAEPRPQSRARRESPTLRPRKQFDFERWSEEQSLNGDLEDEGCDFELTADDGGICGVASWNGARYVVTDFARRARRRRRRAQAGQA